jgi:hypothetical protein
MYQVFADYNCTSMREERLTAEMIAGGVPSSPAELWALGHATGIGYRRHIPQDDLITLLLPDAKATIQASAVRYADQDYMSNEVVENEWTTIARNMGRWSIPIKTYPGSLFGFWTPRPGANGLMHLRLTDESRAPKTVSQEEWLDAKTYRLMSAHFREHDALMKSLNFRAQMEFIRKRAIQLTKEAMAKASDTSPTMTQARKMEEEATQPANPGANSEADAQSRDAMADHVEMVRTLFDLKG